MKTIAEANLTQAELDRLFHGEVTPSEEDIIQRDHRTCDCALTYVHRKRHAALGTAIEIRLCCLAKFIEKQFNLPKGTFFKEMEFEPSWVWDCDYEAELKRVNPDGTRESITVKRGAPPRWLRERMLKKGIEVKNLPKDIE